MGINDDRKFTQSDKYRDDNQEPPKHAKDRSKSQEVSHAPAGCSHIHRQDTQQPQIAEQYRINQSMVSLIRSGKRWYSLTAALPQYLRMDYRHTRSGRRKLTAPQVRDIFTSSLGKQILIDAYSVDRRTIERICRGELHGHITQHLTR